MDGQEVVTVGSFETPLGAFGAVLTGKGLARLTFPGEPSSNLEEWVARWFPAARKVEDEAGLANVACQLNAYLDGRLRRFEIPLDMCGTPFQLEVWKALEEIGYGEIRSYSQVAVALNRPKAVRAVGAANGANPVPIIVPCHRVIGSGSNLTGYGGGLELKEYLLKLEGALLI